MAGRHGNKGIVARVRHEDMPFLKTRQLIYVEPIIHVCIGQIYETVLGWWTNWVENATQFLMVLL
jgi:DNA-directed RNA polymerase beta subunit